MDSCNDCPAEGCSDCPKSGLSSFEASSDTFGNPVEVQVESFHFAPPLELRLSQLEDDMGWVLAAVERLLAKNAS